MMPKNEPSHPFQPILQLAVGLLIGCSVSAAPLASSTVAPGVVFNTYRLAMPNDVFVLSVERSRAEYELRVGWPGDARNFSSRASTTAIISAAEQAGLNVIGAVNASFFSFESIDVTGATGSSGELQQAPNSGFDTAIIGTDRQAAIIEDIRTQASFLKLPSGNSLAISGYNRAHTAGQLTFYTGTWGQVQHSLGNDAVAIVINRLSGPPRAQREFAGKVSAIRTGADANNLTVPADGAIVLADSGFTALRTIAVNHLLRFKIGASANELNNLDLALTGVGHLLLNGAANTANWAQYQFANVRHPRTVLAWNDSHWFLMVVDGRSSRSVGMTFAEMADFLLSELQATDAVNLDGGGSSTMVVDGTVRNVPSDGRQRAIANVLLLVSNPTTRTFLPFADPFEASGRRSEWDDKFTFNDVIQQSTPSGDNTALRVQDPTGGVETVRAGKWGDRNYAIQARVWCQNRADEAASGYERYALFARDTGTGALGLPSFGSGNCYALTYDAHTGQFQAGIYRNGTLTDFSGGSLVQSETAWRTLRIECFGQRIRYLVDGVLLADVINTERPHGFFGVGYHEFFNDNALITGTYVDEVVVTSAFGDANADDEIGVYDIEAQAFCLSGPESDFAGGFFCRNSDLDGDADVDIRDVSLLQQFYGLTAP